MRHPAIKSKVFCYNKLPHSPNGRLATLWDLFGIGTGYHLRISIFSVTDFVSRLSNVYRRGLFY